MDHLPHVCIPRILPDVASVPDGAARIALLRAKKFPNGSQLRVAFSGGSSSQRKNFQATCEEMMRYANLDFTMAKQGQVAEIRVTFDPRGGAWSFIGTDILQQPKNKATMNLGFDEAGTYMHELGHTVGAIHEHQNPAGGIKWNKEAVYRDLSGPPNNWDRETIDHNMFEAYSVDQLNGTRFDPKSIMLYAIPARWTLDGFSSEPNAVLSEQDKAWLREQYPGRGGGDPPPNPPTGEIAIPVYDLEPSGESIGQPGERDLFKFVLSRAGRVRIEASGPTSVVMALFGPNSPTNLISKTDNVLTPFNAKIDASLNPGNYYVQVTHAEATGTGKYGVRVLRFTDGDTLLNVGGGSDRVVIVSPNDVTAGRYGLTKI